MVDLPKVWYFYGPLRTNQNILSFQVSVECLQFTFVQKIHCPSNLKRNFYQVPFIQLVCLKDVGQSAILTKFRHNAVLVLSVLKETNYCKNTRVIAFRFYSFIELKFSLKCFVVEKLFYCDRTHKVASERNFRMSSVSYNFTFYLKTDYRCG